MKRIKLIARQRHIEPKTGKRYSDAKLMTVNAYYEDVFEKYGVTHVITYKNSKMNMIIKKSHDQNYEKLYEDDHFTIWQRLNA